MDKIAQIAEKLSADWWARASYEALTGELALEDMEEAYQAQTAVQARLSLRRGAIVGRKIALTSQAMQQMVGVDSPVTGAIFARDVRQSPARISADGFCRLGIEFELAVTLNRDIAPTEAPHDASTVRALIGRVHPAFELIEDRAADYSDLDILTLVADNAWCGGIVMGEEIPGWQALDLADLPAVVRQDGQPDETARSGAADPLGSLAWVLNDMAAREIPLRAGEVVITGSVLRTRFPSPGDHFRFEIGGASAEMTVT